MQRTQGPVARKLLLNTPALGVNDSMLGERRSPFKSKIVPQVLSITIPHTHASRLLTHQDSNADSSLGVKRREKKSFVEHFPHVMVMLVKGYISQLCSPKETRSSTY